MHKQFDKQSAETDPEDQGGVAAEREDNPATPQAEDGDTQGKAAGKQSEMTVEDYQAELAKVRREAAKYRTERNELKPLADKAREAEEAGKTELQKAQERITALEAEKAAAEQSVLRATVSQATGVPSKFIHGETEEEMTEYATELVEAMNAVNKPNRKLVVDSVGRSSAPAAPYPTTRRKPPPWPPSNATQPPKATPGVSNPAGDTFCPESRHSPHFVVIVGCWLVFGL